MPNLKDVVIGIVQFTVAFIVAFVRSNEGTLLVKRGALQGVFFFSSGVLQSG